MANTDALASGKLSNESTARRKMLQKFKQSPFSETFSFSEDEESDDDIPVAQPVEIKQCTRRKAVERPLNHQKNAMTGKTGIHSVNRSYSVGGSTCHQSRTEIPADKDNGRNAPLQSGAVKKEVGLISQKAPLRRAISFNDIVTVFQDGQAPELRFCRLIKLNSGDYSFVLEPIKRQVSDPEASRRNPSSLASQELAPGLRKPENSKSYMKT